jgi:hypothetical protein
MPCLTGHPDVKANLHRLRTETVPLGAQLAADGTVDCYLRNCLRCQSTIGIEIAMAEKIEDLNGDLRQALAKTISSAGLGNA